MRLRLYVRYVAGLGLGQVAAFDPVLGVDRLKKHSLHTVGAGNKYGKRGALASITAPF